MNQNPLVSIICSCYNHCNYVIESLQSALNQTYKNIQIIVVDDFSVDNSVAVIESFIKEYPEIIFIKNKTNLGVTKSVNQAIHHSKGDYFIDLAADDLLLQNCVEIQVRTFLNSEYQNLAIVYGNAELIDHNGSHLSYYFDVNNELKALPARPTGDIFTNVISTETTICSVSALYKMSVFKDLNCYDESLYYEDLDYWIRASRNYSIEFIDEVLIKKRILENSMHAGFIKNHHFVGKSTYIIMKKAATINTSKFEDKVLRSHVLLGIKRSVKEVAPVLLLKNSLLWLHLKIRKM
jgi:glycosyltransferase involved in cell wall biosynthesis